MKVSLVVLLSLSLSLFQACSALEPSSDSANRAQPSTESSNHAQASSNPSNQDQSKPSGTSASQATELVAVAKSESAAAAAQTEKPLAAENIINAKTGSLSVAEQAAAPVAPSLLAPAALEAEIVKLEPGLNIRSYFDKMRVKNIGGADQSINQALDLKRMTLVILVKPGCIYCDSLLAVMKGSRIKTKSPANIIFVTDSAHASIEEYKAKAEANKKLGKWLYDYSDKFAEIFGVTAFPQFIVVGKDGKVIKYQRGLVVPENKETLVGKDTAVVLQTLGRSTLKWLEQF